MISRRHFLGAFAGATALAVSRGTLAQQAAARLVLLGTKGGPSMRNVAQVPSSSALIVGDAIYVIDAGYGVTYRMIEKKLSLAAIRAIFITHHHSDHNLELGNLLYNAWANSMTHSIEVYGPSGVDPLLKAFMESNRFDIETRMADEGRPDLRKVVDVHTYGEGLVMEDDRVRVTALRNHHPPITESYALKFAVKEGPVVVFSGDTSYLPGLAEFARGCDYLVHEVMYGPALERLVRINPSAKTLMDHLRASHTLTEDVGRIAGDARAKNLVLDHFVPGGDPQVTDEDWVRDVRKHYAGNIIVGRDLMEIALR